MLEGDIIKDLQAILKNGLILPKTHKK